MADEKIREITIYVRDREGMAVRHLEGPTDHQTAEDVAADIVTHMDSRFRGKLKTIPGTER
jgi:hypothetical protein